MVVYFPHPQSFSILEDINLTWRSFCFAFFSLLYLSLSIYLYLSLSLFLISPCRLIEIHHFCSWNPLQERIISTSILDVQMP